MERVRERWTEILLVAFLLVGGTYVHTIDTGLGSFLWAVTALVFAVALVGPVALRAIGPTWNRIRRKNREAIIGYLFASPWIIGFLVFTLGPLLFSLYAAFCKYDIVNPPALGAAIRHRVAPDDRADPAY